MNPIGISTKNISLFDSTSYPDIFHSLSGTQLQCLNITPINFEKSKLNVSKNNDKIIESNLHALHQNESNFSSFSVDYLAARVQSLLGKSMPLPEKSSESSNVSEDISESVKQDIKTQECLLTSFSKLSSLENDEVVRSSDSNNSNQAISFLTILSDNKYASIQQSDLKQTVCDLESNKLENQVNKIDSIEKDSSSILEEVNKVLNKIKEIQEKSSKTSSISSGLNDPNVFSSPTVETVKSREINVDNLNIDYQKSISTEVDNVEIFTNEVSDITEYYPIKEKPYSTYQSHVYKFAENCLKSASEKTSQNNTKNSLPSHDLKLSPPNSNKGISQEKFLQLVEIQQSYLKQIQKELARLEKVYIKQHRAKKTKESKNLKKEKNCPDRENRSSSKPRGMRFDSAPGYACRRDQSSSASSLSEKALFQCCAHLDRHGNNVYAEHERIATAINKVKSDSNLCRQKKHRCSLCSCKMVDHLYNTDCILERLNMIALEDEHHGNNSRSRTNAKHSKSNSSNAVSQNLNNHVNRSVQTSLIIDQSDRNLQLSSQQNHSKVPISWFLTFENTTNKSNTVNQHHPHRKESPALQQAFERNCNRFKLRSSMRVQRIKDNELLRVKTADQRQEDIAQTYFMKKTIENEQVLPKTQKSTHRLSSKEKNISDNCPRPLSLITRRVFTHKEMRAQTEKIYSKLPEVRAQKVSVKREDDAKRRRMMADIFKKKLKENAIRGKLNWPITSQAITA